VALIERGNSELSLTTQADLLSISRSSLYYKAAAPSPREVAVKHRIDEVYTKYPFYGSRRITELLRREGQRIKRETVRQYMREMGIQGICPGPNTSKRSLAHRIYPYLLRHTRASYPNHVWGIDLTYIRLEGGWMYLVAVIDWYSRYVVSWELDSTMGIAFVIEAVDKALQQARPIIWNSDQGAHFTSAQYIGRLAGAGIQISMDGKGRALDNIFTERFWRSIKYEEVYLHSYTSPKEARQGISRYMNFYNHERLHQALAYRTPAEVYRGINNVAEQAAKEEKKGASHTLETANFLS
jgi:putative transposase